MTDRIPIGRVSGVSGVKGEIKLFHYSGERERIVGIEELFFLPVGAEGGAGEGFARRKVLTMRYRGRTPILLVEGVGTRSAAEGLVGAEVYADRGALAPLGEDGYYVDEITGFVVVGEDGARIGAVAGVIGNPAHDILCIEPARGGGELLLPMVDSFILSVDKAAGEIRVRPPDGFADGSFE